jgi:hypothetical protein
VRALGKEVIKKIKNFFVECRSQGTRQNFTKIKKIFAE